MMGKVKGEFFIDDSAMQIPGRSRKKHRCIGSVCCCVFGLRALRAQWRLVGQDANTAACRCSGCDDWTRRTLSQSGAILQVWSSAVCANGKCWKLRGRSRACYRYARIAWTAAGRGKQQDEGRPLTEAPDLNRTRCRSMIDFTIARPGPVFLAEPCREVSTRLNRSTILSICSGATVVP